MAASLIYKPLPVSGSLPFRWPNGGSVPMCDKCDQLEKKIEHYRRIPLSIGDPVTIERVEALIADLQAQKATLHPEQKQSGRRVYSVCQEPGLRLCEVMYPTISLTMAASGSQTAQCSNLRNQP